MAKDVTPKQRLDSLLFERGLAESREKARRLILAGQVEVEGVSDPKPGLRVPVNAGLSVKTPERYVSRGGLKLEAALAQFGIDPSGRICADIGTSTGGFTDCLLQHGAARVYAVDVGASQIHEKLRRDPRVVLVEHTNARELQEGSLPEAPSLVVIDVSFISLGKVLPALAQAAAPGATLIALVKPQFEATRSEVSRGKGIIRDPDVHRRILRGILEEAPRWGWRPLALAPSPISGGSGNREYLMQALRLTAGEEGAPTAASTPDAAASVPDIDIDALVRQTLMGK